jgi:YbbR domain-containing protein
VGPLSGFFSRNWTLKLSALGLALLLWISVRVEAPNRQELSGVPVRVDLADPGWALTDPPMPATVQVRFGGPSRELFRMAMDRPSLVIPMDQVVNGDTIVVLRNQWVRVQDRPGVVVESIQPSTVRLVLEPIERVALPPALRFRGELPQGLAFAAPPVAAPGDIRVSGPRSRIAALDSVPLAPVDLSTVRSSGMVSTGVATDGFEGLQLQPLAVELEFRVEDRVERVVSGVPITLPEDGVPEDMEILPTTAAIRLSGARSLLERVDPTALRLVVDPDGREWPEPGDEGDFPLRLEGIPDLVQGVPEPGEATVRRPEADPEGGPDQEPGGEPGGAEGGFP